MRLLLTSLFIFSVLILKAQHDTTFDYPLHLPLLKLHTSGNLPLPIEVNQKIYIQGSIQFDTMPVLLIVADTCERMIVNTTLIYDSAIHPFLTPKEDTIYYQANHRNIMWTNGFVVVKTYPFNSFYEGTLDRSNKLRSIDFICYLDENKKRFKNCFVASRLQY